MDFLAALFYLLTGAFRRGLTLIGPSASARRETLFPVAVFRLPLENKALSFAFLNDVFVFLRLSDQAFRFRFALSPPAPLRFAIPFFSDGRSIFRSRFLMLSPALCSIYVFRHRQALFRP